MMKCANIICKKRERAKEIRANLSCVPVRRDDQIAEAEEPEQNADSIDEAWKREKSQSWHQREMEELILRHEKEVNELKEQIGNAAAMREALLKIKSLFRDIDLSRDTPENDAYAIAESALSAPPRNCDRFADELDAQLAFLNEVWLITVDRETMLARDKYENWSDEMRTAYGRWLLGAAMEGGCYVE